MEGPINRDAGSMVSGGIKKLKVAILGSGNIGTDLLIKSLRSPLLEPTLFIGRKMGTPGIERASKIASELKAKGNRVPFEISDRSLDAIVAHPEKCDLVFDCTSALEAVKTAPVLAKLNKTVVDLTPALLGPMCVPAVNMKECLGYQNVNMVTCGGQASIPLAWVLGQTYSDIDHIEVVSSISSRSAGAATRINLDEYIHTTEKGLKKFSGAKSTKTILNVNPAAPCIDMQTTVFCITKNPDIEQLRPRLLSMVDSLREYVPGYNLIVGPVIENGRIVIMVKVKGLGDYLPAYAGNLDIINCAAMATAERFAVHAQKSGVLSGAERVSL